jgi:transposase-like protein
LATSQVAPVEVVTDKAPSYVGVMEELLPGAFDNLERHANNRIEADHGRLKARVRPMRGLKAHATAEVVVAGHALVQNIRRGHYELGVEAPRIRRVAAAFAELALAM